MATSLRVILMNVGIGRAVPAILTASNIFRPSKKRLALIAILPIAFYPFFGGKIWCRYWCPAVGLMNVFHKIKPKSLKTFGIASRKERCIACGMCDRFCEVGVPVKSFALKGRSFDMSNSSCISCGICISVCPTRVLSFSTSVPLTIGIAEDSSPKNP